MFNCTRYINQEKLHCTQFKIHTAAKRQSLYGVQKYIISYHIMGTKYNQFRYKLVY